MIWLEALSYLVTILGFPIAILVFIYEHRRRLGNEENELHRHLSEEQLEPREIIYRMLVSLFEKAYINKEKTLNRH